MKELRQNMRLVGTLVVIAFIALSAWLALTVFEQGSIWASSSYNTRLTNTGAMRGTITDRDGTVLAASDSEGRKYLENTAARRQLQAAAANLTQRTDILPPPILGADDDKGITYTHR